MIIRNAKELGLLVRDRRAQRSLTQAELAKAVGASRKWVVDLEGGKRTLDLSLVLRALNALGMELDARDRLRAKGAIGESRETLSGNLTGKVKSARRLHARQEIDIDEIVDGPMRPKR